MTDSRIRKCPIHSLRPRCPGCEAERKPDGVFPTLEVPKGTVEWLREAARWFVTEGDDGALAFVEWSAWTCGRWHEPRVGSDRSSRA